MHLYISMLRPLIGILTWITAANSHGASRTWSPCTCSKIACCVLYVIRTGALATRSSATTWKSRSCMADEWDHSWDRCWHATVWDVLTTSIQFVNCFCFSSSCDFSNIYFNPLPKCCIPVATSFYTTQQISFARMGSCKITNNGLATYRLQTISPATHRPCEEMHSFVR